MHPGAPQQSSQNLWSCSLAPGYASKHPGLGATASGGTPGLCSGEGRLPVAPQQAGDRASRPLTEKPSNLLQHNGLHYVFYCPYIIPGLPFL